METRQDVLALPSMTALRSVPVSVTELNEVSWGLYLARLNAQARLDDVLRVHGDEKEHWSVQNAQEDLNNIKCAEIYLNRIMERAYVAPIIGEDDVSW